MAKAWRGGALAALFAGVLSAQTPSTVKISASLVAELDSVADTASVEHFRCLVGGYFTADTLVVIGAWEPPIQHADYNTVTAVCPISEHIIGTWHNHIPFNVPMNDPHNRQHRVEPWSVCELSPADRRSAEKEPWALTMISVANGVHCAWLRVQDAEGVMFQRLPWAVP